MIELKMDVMHQIPWPRQEGYGKGIRVRVRYSPNEEGRSFLPRYANPYVQYRAGCLAMGLIRYCRNKQEDKEDRQ